MNILLVVPINRSYVIMPSLGIGYLATIAKEQGHKVKILHCLKEKMNFNDFAEYIGKEKPDLIGFTMFTMDFKPVGKHIELIRKHSPESIVVVGGPHPSGEPEGSVKWADYGFTGEAEIGFSKLLSVLDKRGSAVPEAELKEIPGLVWKKNSQTVINPEEFIENLDELGFPAWDLMDPRDFPEAPHGAFIKSHPSAPIIITRGCSFQCTFCAGKCITGTKVRKRSIENVIDEIKYLNKNFGVHEFLIEDENFTLYRKLVQEFCDRILKEDLKINFSFPSGVRLDTLNTEMLMNMKRAGCHSLSVGIEFGSERILKLTNKKLTINVIEDKIKLIKQAGIKITGFFLMGIPGESFEEMKQTVRLSRRLPIDRAQFNNFMPLPGSELYYQLKKEGKLNGIDTNSFFVHDVAFAPEGVSKKQIKQLQRWAYISFYTHPRRLFKILKDVKGIKHFYFLVKRFIDGLK